MRSTSKSTPQNSGTYIRVLFTDLATPFLLAVLPYRNVDFAKGQGLILRTSYILIY